MPVLNCSAITCVYNKDELCSKGEIQVGGANATEAGQTCCESFQERRGESMKDSAGCGCTTVGIDCAAQDCAFNEKCKCSAGAINICGSNACQCEDTKCGTFQCRQ